MASLLTRNLKPKVLEQFSQNALPTEVVRQFEGQVSQATIYRWWKQWQDDRLKVAS